MSKAAASVALTLAVATTAAAAAQPGSIAFKRVPIPEDVPAHLVTAMAQDLDGFLWIGTQAGLVRYDGYQFRAYKEVGYVRTLFAASDGRLWIGTFSGGVSVFDPATEAFERYQHDPADPKSLSHNRVEAVAEDRSGHVWIATYAELF